MPGILERRDLRVRFMASGSLVYDVVIAFGIERRIEIDQIDGVVWEVIPIPQDFEIVTVVKGIGVKGH